MASRATNRKMPSLPRGKAPFLVFGKRDIEVAHDSHAATVSPASKAKSKRPAPIARSLNLLKQIAQVYADTATTAETMQTAPTTETEGFAPIARAHFLLKRIPQTGYAGTTSTTGTTGAAPTTETDSVGITPISRAPQTGYANTAPTEDTTGTAPTTMETEETAPTTGTETSALVGRVPFLLDALAEQDNADPTVNFAKSPIPIAHGELPRGNVASLDSATNSRVRNEEDTGVINAQLQGVNKGLVGSPTVAPTSLLLALGALAPSAKLPTWSSENRTNLLLV
ncbi:hypothetical protein EI94DRAFT_1807815 [Lactarius quietus]|nr:hypothetical protein EI94DRAFT_1807815 [Lactarius quietus]